jgi:hypothetical protein
MGSAARVNRLAFAMARRTSIRPIASTKGSFRFVASSFSQPTISSSRRSHSSAPQRFIVAARELQEQFGAAAIPIIERSFLSSLPGPSCGIALGFAITASENSIPISAMPFLHPANGFSADTDFGTTAPQRSHFHDSPSSAQTQNIPRETLMATPWMWFRYCDLGRETRLCEQELWSGRTQ